MGFIPYGVISKPHRTKGEVCLVPYSRDFSNLSFIKTVFIEIDKTAGFKKYNILGHSISSKYAILNLQGLETIEQAEELKGLEVFVDTDELSISSDDEYYFFELVGLSVFTTDNKLVGKVTKLTDRSFQDILVIKMLNGKESLIPLVEPIVKEIDIANKRIIIDPPQGLLEL